MVRFSSIRDHAYGGPLYRSDWNFSRVPDSEVVACCLWEYARESPTIALAAGVHEIEARRIRAEGKPPPSDKERKAQTERDCRIQAQVKRARFDYNKFLERFWASDVGHVRFYDRLREYVGSGALRWQQIPGKARRALVAQLSEATLFEALAPSLICDLELLWKANSVELMKVRSVSRPPQDDTEDGLLYSPSISIAASLGEENQLERTRTVAFTVDFSRYSNAEIEAAFRRWLIVSRPRRWRRQPVVFPTAPRRGRKRNDYRVALERLGMMRLLHWNTPTMLRIHVPEAWKLYGRKERVFRREIQAAIRFFRECFPFLPRDERPETHERYSTWFSALQRELDDLDAGRGIK